MTCPKLTLRGKTIFLLSGYRPPPRLSKRGVDDNTLFRIEAEDKLREMAMRHPEAVAFGFVAGRWLPGA